MARFLIGTMPMVGHVNPGLPIAQALVRHGHEVRWYTGRRFQARVEATGARFVPMRAAPDFDDQDLEAHFPGISRRTGLDAFKFGVKHLFIDSIPGQVRDYQQILSEFPADVLLSDTAFVGPVLLHELGGPPWAVFGISALTISSRDTAPFGLALPPATSMLGRLRNRALNWLFANLLFRDVAVYYTSMRRQIGLPPSPIGPLDAVLSPFLYLQGTTPAFEYPHSDLPPQVHFIGPFLPDQPADFTPPLWWEELLIAGRPVVHVTQGTIATEAGALIAPTIQALAEEDVLVIVTTGGKPIETVGLDRLPANVRLERFIPHAALLPHVDVMVTNGGYGGTQVALANGVPLVAAGTTEEKPEVCARIAWAGAGINLKTNTPTAAQVRAAVKTILSDPSYRHNAQRIKADFAQYDPAKEAVHLLERLAVTRQPVVRTPVRSSPGGFFPQQPVVES
jgi:MGT family glycosyltransferase